MNYNNNCPQKIESADMVLLQQFLLTDMKWISDARKSCLNLCTAEGAKPY